MDVGQFCYAYKYQHITKDYKVNKTAHSASAGVKICLANLAKDQHFL